jgi:hypothetical protein
MVLPAMRSIVRRRAALTMRVYDFAAENVLILRSPPPAGVSKDGRKEDCSKLFPAICDSPAPPTTARRA